MVIRLRVLRVSEAVLLVLRPQLLLLLVLPPPCLGLSTCLPGSPLEGHIRLLHRDRVVEGSKIKV